MRRAGKRKHLDKRPNGYFLAEIVVALAVLGIFLIAVVPLMSDSFRNIMRSSQWSSQMMSTQNSVARISATALHGTGLSTSTASFPIKYTSIQATAYGRQVTQNGLTAGFFYNNENVPRIELSPAMLEEGYEPYPTTSSTVRMTVFGTNTTFISGVTSVTVTDNAGAPVSIFNVQVDSANNRKLTFELPLGLTNSLSPYEVTVTTNNDVASAPLQIGLPRALAVGSASGGNALVLVSSGNGGIEGTEDFPGRRWTVKSCPASLNLNDAAINSAADTWVAVGPSGNIKIWKDGETWRDGVITSGGTTPTLNAVTFFEKYTSTSVIQRFVAVGNGGVIYTSDDGLNWVQRTSPTTNNLYDVCASWDTNPDDSTDNSRLVAVGANGTVCTSTDGITWTYNSINDGLYTFTLYSVVFADQTPSIVGDEEFWAGGHLQYFDFIFPFWHDRAGGVELGPNGTTRGSVVILPWTNSNIKEILYFYTNTWGNPYLYAVDDEGRILVAQPGFFGSTWNVEATISGKSFTAADVTETGLLIMTTSDGKIYTKQLGGTDSPVLRYNGSTQINGICIR